MKIGDKIRDIEDLDCYYEGVIIQLIPLRYRITKIVWCGELDDSKNNEITGLLWWKTEIL